MVYPTAEIINRSIAPKFSFDVVYLFYINLGIESSCSRICN